MFEGARSILSGCVQSQKPKKRDDRNDNNNDSATKIKGRGESGDANLSSLLANVRGLALKYITTITGPGG